MASYWNARQLLDVYPQEQHFTCVGTTLQGRRCRQSFLKNVHKAEADRILDFLPEEFRARPTELLPTLRHLAWLTLCPRWHQNGAKCQADTVAARWLRIITSSTSVTTAYTYGGYQAPTSFPLSPPQSPLPRHSTRYTALPSPQTYHPPAVLQLSPPVSPNQEYPRAAPQNRGRASTSSILPQVSSSIRTTNQNGSTRIDISVVFDQPIQPNTTGRAPEGVHAARSVSDQDNRRSQIFSDHLRNNQASTHSRVSSSAVSRMITTRNVQDILARLESLERQVARVQSRSSSASSRSSGSLLGAPSSSNSDPRSPIGSTSTSIYQQLPIGHPNLYFSPPRSPAPTPHAGSLSISTDSRSVSSFIGSNTPSSSGASTPAVLPPLATPAAPIVATPGPAVPQAGVQRRQITASTTCFVCLEHIYGPADAVWCRGTCGQNVHLDCSNRWIETRVSDGLSITCPFCRQPWVF